MVKIFTFITALGLVSSATLSANGFSDDEANPTPKGLTALEIFQGWQSLSGNQDHAKWKTTQASNLEGRWVYGDNTISLTPGVGDLHTKDSFDNFELELEWKVSKNGQSGIIVAAATGSSPAWKSGFRFQISDNESPRISDHTEFAGSCYHLIAAPKKAARKAGAWNKVRIVKQGQHFQFFLNNIKTADFLANSPTLKKAIKGDSKYNKFPQFGNFTSGYICLEDRGSAISFRNVKIRSLESFVAAKVDRVVD